MTRYDARKMLREIARRAGIAKDVSPHWLRHAHAAHSMLHGAPPNVVQRTLGHASLRTTSIYAQLAGEESSGDYLDVGE